MRFPSYKMCIKHINNLNKINDYCIKSKRLKAFSGFWTKNVDEGKKSDSDVQNSDSEKGSIKTFENQNNTKSHLFCSKLEINFHFTFEIN